MIALAELPTLAAALPPPDADASMSLLDYIRAGGWIGYVIMLMSLIAVTHLIMHAIRIRGAALAPQHAIDELDSLLSRGRVDEAIAFCRAPDNDCFLTRVVGSGLDRYRRSPFGALELKAAMEEAGQEQVARLGRSLDAMAVIASIAPMLGLLGTVVGILGAFSTISSSQGFARPDQLAGDISLALVTTIQGLIVAIPATAVVTYFRNRIEKLAAETAIVIDDLAVHLEGARVAAPRAVPMAASVSPAVSPASTPRPGMPETAPAAPTGPARPAEPASSSRRPDHPPQVAGAST